MKWMMIRKEQWSYQKSHTFPSSSFSFDHSILACQRSDPKTIIYQHRILASTGEDNVLWGECINLKSVQIWYLEMRNLCVLKHYHFHTFFNFHNHNSKNFCNWERYLTQEERHGKGKIVPTASQNWKWWLGRNTKLKMMKQAVNLITGHKIVTQSE